MREGYGAELFEERLAELHPRTDEWRSSGRELGEAVDMARELLRLDLASASRVREPLRQRLEAAITAGDRQPPPLPRSGTRTWRLAYAVGGFVLLAALAALVSPAARSVLAAPFRGILERIGVGERTDLVRSAPKDAREVQRTFKSFTDRLREGAAWQLHTPYAGFGGAVPRGADPAVRLYSSLKLITAAVDFPILVPTAYPEGLNPLLRFREGYVTPGGQSAVLFFFPGPLEVMLAETWVGEEAEVRVGHFVGAPGGGAEGGEIRQKTLQVDGRQVVWLLDPDSDEIGSLFWEADGVSYQLSGKTLTRERAEKLYASLERYAAAGTD